MRHRTTKYETGRARLARTLPLLSSLFLVTILCIAGNGIARADSQVRAVRLSNVSGNVQVSLGAPDTPVDAAASQAYANMPLTEGTHLQAGEDGRAEVQFEDSSVARLTPNSSVSMVTLRRDGSGVPVNGVQVLSGLVYFETGKVHTQPMTVQFGNVQVNPAKGSILRVNLDAKPAELSVMHGSAHVAGSGYTVDVHENETVKFDAGDPAHYDVSQGASGDTWDEWNADRDQALASLASRETREAALNGGGGAGWSDLDYYGNWYQVPGYGNVWSPYGASAGWDPYGMGYWGYYPGYGYQWISGYPWGWMPYRCGSWNYFGSGYGWGWSPASCGGGSGWGFGNSYGAGGGGIVIVNAPHGYKLPERPARPHPVAPGGNLPLRTPAVIAVNRGGEASRLDSGSAGLRTPQRVMQVGGQPVTPLPKTVNATPQSPAGTIVKPTLVPLHSAGPSNAPFVPVARPYSGPVGPVTSTAAPSGGVYSSRPAGIAQPLGGGRSGGSAQPVGGSHPAPSFSGGAASHGSAPAPSAGASHGGGAAPSSGGAHR